MMAAPDLDRFPVRALGGCVAVWDEQARCYVAQFDGDTARADAVAYARRLAATAATLPLVRPRGEMPAEWYDAYCAAALDRLTRRDTARTWWALGLDARDAGQWAAFRFTPEQAWAWIDRGLAPTSVLGRPDAPPRP
jgi:hypothetical protein